MKSYSRLLTLYSALAFGGVAALPLDAAVLTYTFDGLNQPIPDGSALGFSDTRNISAPGYNEIVEVKIGLHVTAGFNGDLYIQLVNSHGVAVIMNRVGKDANNEFGYSEGGFNILFSDAPPALDIHFYGATMPGDEAPTVPGGVLISGIWAVDGRLIDPSLVLDTTPRTAMLDSFTGGNPNDTWTLFIADLESGGVSALQSWELQITAVPETTIPTAVLLSFIAFVFRRIRDR